MSEQLPNEKMDQQFNDLPLPDEEASWQKMKELLERDDDDDRIVPPVFLRSCLGWGMFLLVGLGVAWFFIRPEKWWNETNGTTQTSSAQKEKEHLTRDRNREEQNTISPQRINKENPDQRSTLTVSPETATSKKNNVDNSSRNENITKIKLPVNRGNKKKLSTDIIREKEQENKTLSQKNIPKNNKNVQTDTNQTNKNIAPENGNNQQKDSITAVADLTPPLNDTTKKDNPAQLQDSIIQKKKEEEQMKFFLAAGIGEQQQIPVAGQSAVPYSSYGRRGSLSDYAPSLYVQLQKEKKWFVQAEFRYGAAQSLRELSYNRQTKFDTGTKNVSVTTMRLKKTYYHQLPLSFNYYVKPNFSIGVGGIYSRFYRAITEREIQTVNVQTQAVTNSKEIIPVRNFTDSFLYKTQVHVLLQADYQWRKFSVGLRYTKDVQPYIKYTKPDGTINEERNQSLQLIVRYRIWRSRNF